MFWVFQEYFVTNDSEVRNSMDNAVERLRAQYAFTKWASDLSLFINEWFLSIYVYLHARISRIVQAFLFLLDSSSVCSFIRRVLLVVTRNEEWVNSLVYRSMIVRLTFKCLYCAEVWSLSLQSKLINISNIAGGTSCRTLLFLHLYGGLTYLPGLNFLG